MKNHVIFLVLFLAIVQNVHSQKNSGNERTNTNSYITVTPTTLLDFYAPRLRVGYTQHVADHWKIGLDLGLGDGTSLFSQREFEFDILWEVRPEVYFILKPTSRTIKYLSTEFFYINQSVTLLNDGYQRKDGMDFLYDRADFERQKYGMHIKFGLFLNFGRHWGLNFYGGIGFRFKDTSFDNLVNAREGSIDHRNRHGFITIYEIEESDFKPNPALGFKVFYRF